MPFIGNQPTAVPLTSADLEDNIISTAKIQDDAVTTAKTSYSDAPFRNIIINGDMSIAQRGTSVSGITGAGYNTIDRFRFSLSSAGTWTQTQSTDVPSGQGFAYSLKMDCTTANASLSAGSSMMFNQRVEGQNVQYLKKGTSNAESLTLSFWVKSNKTGTYIIEIFDRDNTRQISKSYTISSADTWEKKIITFEGDTTGAFDNDNANSLDLLMWLVAGTDITSGTLNTSWNSSTNANRAVGQVNLADSTSNYINITGLQLEAGTTASDFEFLPTDVNLQRCQRYFEKSYNYETAIGTATAQGCVFGSGSYSATTTAYLNASTVYSVEKRATPTLTIYDFAGNSGKTTREHFGVGSSNNSNVIITADANPKRFGVTSSTGDNRTHLAYQFTANAEL